MKVEEREAEQFIISASVYSPEFLLSEPKPHFSSSQSWKCAGTCLPSL
jgi:hypothetical protein